MKHVLLVALLLVPIRGYADDVVMGALCVGGPGVTASYDTAHPDKRADGAWIPVHMVYKRANARQQARLILFDRQVPVEAPFNGHLTCDQIASEMAKLNAALLLSGRLNSLTLDGLTFEANKAGDNRFQIDVIKDADLGYVDAALLKVAGGKVDLRGSRLWLTNPATILVTNSSLSGTLELETWNRAIDDAVFRLPGGTSFSTTLRLNPANQNVLFHLNLATLGAELWRGRLSGTPVGPINGQTLIAGPVTLDTPALQIKRVEVEGVAGKFDTRLITISGGAKRAVSQTSPIVATMEAPALTWATASAHISQDPLSFELGDLTLSDAVFSSAESRLEALTQGVILKGQAKATFASLSLASLKGTFDWQAPEAPLFAFLIPGGDVTRVTFSMDGAQGRALMLDGALDAKSFLVGGLRLIRPIHVAFPPTSTSEDIAIPIAISAGPQGGRLEVSDGTHAVLLTAELRRLSLNARCVLTLRNFADSHLDVPATNLQLEVATAVSTSPWLGSTKPLFGSAAVKATNRTALVIGVKTQSGLVLLDTEVLAIGDPVLQFGNAKPFHARTTLNASGGATVAYCLNRGDLVVTRGTFRSIVAEFTSLDPGATVDIGGTMLVDPNGSIKDLSIAIDRANNQGSVSSGAIKLAGTRVSRAHDPARPNDLAFDGALQGPFTIDSLTGTPEFTRDRIDLTSLRALGVNVAMTNATFDLSQAISLLDASVSLKGDQIVSSLELNETNSDVPTPVAPKYLQLKSLEDVCLAIPQDVADNTTRREYLTNVTVEPAGKLRLDGDVGNDVVVQLGNAPTLSNASITVSGRSDRLNGKGGATFAGFTGSIHSAIMTDANCDGGHLLRIPMNTLMATGGTTLAITLVNGKAEAKGPLHALAMQIVSTGKAECEGAWHKQILVAATSGWTEGICPTWSEPLRRCRWTWETPEVSYEYRSKAVVRALSATVLLANPFVGFGEKKTLVCNVGPAVVDPILIIGGYYPEFRGNIPVISDVANALVGVTAEITESTIATALGTGIGGIASAVLSSPTLGPGTCIAMGLWR
jgi:hypothetical protein